MLNPKILVVEDEAPVALDLRKRLSNVGYTVPAIATTAQEAIELAGKVAPDLILMDIKLRGEVTGIEAARQIRTRYGIPIVYLTAYADEVTIQQAKLARPLGYLLKPFSDRALRAAIEVALYRDEAEEDEHQPADGPQMDSALMVKQLWVVPDQFPEASEMDVAAFRRLPRQSDKTPEEATKSTWRLILISQNPQQPLLGLEVFDDVRIGRGAQDIDLDLDLNPYGAEELGVSHFHAMLRPTENGLFLYDTGSTNGTTCNITRLSPHEPQAVAHGDVIGFSSMYFKVKIVSQPC